MSITQEPPAALEALEYFPRCPLHIWYRGGVVGKPIADRPSRCHYCREVWAEMNSRTGARIIPMPDEDLRKLDEYLATVTSVVWHKGGDEVLGRPQEPKQVFPK